MSAEDLLKAGNLDEALATLREAVKRSPADGKLRIFLFQMLCVTGQWEKALTQLQVVSEIDAESMLMAQIYQPVLQCEALRSEVFAGRRSPLIFGEPEEWISLLVQGVQTFGTAASDDARARAFEAAPASPGKLNDQSFEWIADADSRLGPIMEVIMDGKYYWIPFSRIQKVQVSPPTDLRNLVWTAAHFTWTNGGNSPGFIPTRYPATELCADSALRLAKRTDWEQKSEGVYTGLGQRVFATDQTELSVLEVRTIEFSPSPEAA